MEKPKHEIKDRITLALAIREMSPVELSEKAGIPKSSISQYMSGYAKPKDDRIYLISKALDVSEPWLMGYDVDIERKAIDKRELKEIADNMQIVYNDERINLIIDIYKQLDDVQKDGLLNYAKFIKSQKD